MMAIFISVLIFVLALPSHSQAPSRERLAIVDFQILTKPEDQEKYQWISYGFAETLSDAFSRTKKFAVIERTKLSLIIKELNLQKDQIIDTSSVVRAGKLLAVSKMLLGSCQIYDEKMFITMRIVNVETGEIIPIPELPKIVGVDEILQTQEKICLNILKQYDVLKEAEAKQEVQLVTTKSTPSLKAYEFLNRGIQFYNNKQYDEAIQMYNFALSYDKRYRKAYFRRGETNYALSQFEQAAEDFERSEGYLKEDSVYVLMSDAYYQAGNFKKAADYIKKAEKLNPGSIAVMTGVSRLNQAKIKSASYPENKTQDSTGFQTIFEFINGKAKARLKNGNYGYIDTAYKTIIPFIFEEIGEFNLGLAPARTGRKWGYINESGVFVIEPQFEHAEKFTKYEVALVGTKVKYGVVNMAGTLILPIEFDFIYGFGYWHIFQVSKPKGLIPFNSLYGAYDVTGKMIIPPIYDGLDLFPGSYTDRNYPFIHASYKGKWGVINYKNEIIVPFKYASGDCIRKFQNGYAAVKVNERWGFVNEKGLEVVKPIYDNVIDYSSKFFHVKLKGAWGLLESNYQETIKPEFDEPVQPLNGYFKIQYRGKWGLLDSNYNVSISPQYEGLDQLKEYYFAAKKADKWGLIDSKNRIQCGFVYELLGESQFRVNITITSIIKDYYKNNFLCSPVKLNGKEFWINEKCQCVLDCK